MKLNYILNENNQIIGYRIIPFNEEEPWIEIASENLIHLGYSTIIDGVFEEHKSEFEAAQEIVHEKNAILSTIASLKRQLSSTDYQAIKFAEGQLTTEEFAPIRAQRQEWRDRINELENQLAKE